MGMAKVGRTGMREYKKQLHGEERARSRTRLAHAVRGDEDSAAQLSYEQAPWNEWCCPRDGKQWYTGPGWDRK